MGGLEGKKVGATPKGRTWGLAIAGRDLTMLNRCERLD
jgi:hypothetical protein